MATLQRQEIIFSSPKASVAVLQSLESKDCWRLHGFTVAVIYLFGLEGILIQYMLPYPLSS